MPKAPGFRYPSRLLLLYALTLSTAALYFTGEFAYGGIPSSLAHILHVYAETYAPPTRSDFAT
jgi:hypothetical protein